MGALIIIAIAIAAVAAFEVLVARYGVDSRDGSLDPRQPYLRAGIN